MKRCVTFAFAALLTALLLAASSACASMAGKGDPPPDVATLVEYSRSGGFAGFSDHVVIHGDGRAHVRRRGGEKDVALDAARLARVKAVLDGAGLESLRDVYKSEGADLFTYMIVVRGKTITCTDGAVPPALEPVIRALQEVIDTAGVSPR